MLASIARFSIRRRRHVLVATALLAVIAAVFGTTVFGRMTQGGFDDFSSESWRGSQLLDTQFHQEAPNFILLVDGKGASVDSPAVKTKGDEIARDLANQPNVKDVVSYWAIPDAPGLRSHDGTQALILAVLDLPDEEMLDVSHQLTDKFTQNTDVRVTAGGFAEINRQINEQVESDLARGELISFPVVLIALVLIFGGLVAAGLPLAVGGLSILGTFLILRLLTEVVDVSIFSLNLTTMLGLGLGIDYSLFIMTRYREELRKGLSTDDAIVVAIQTGGRTVLFSALVVAISLAALMVFPLYFLRSFAYAGVSVVTVAALSSLVFMPAMLAAVGPRIDKFRILHRASPDEGSGFWSRMARLVMRRPLVITGATIAVLVLFALPFFNVKWGSTDDRALPVSAPARQVADTIRNNFDGSESGAVSIVMPTISQSQGAQLSEYAAAVSKVDGIRRVAGPTGTFVDGTREDIHEAEQSAPVTANGAVLRAYLAVEPISPQGEQLIKDVRAIPSPSERLVTGFAASFVDNKQPILERAPLAGALIAVATLLVLFLMTGSVILPFKAVALGALSLTATFGAMVWIFQEGHLSGLLDFTAVGALDITNPIIMFCIAFGLSMDYEVFLLSRIKEAYDKTHDTEAAVATGLGNTGRVVTAAAVLIALVFLSFATSGISFIKLIGFGCALAVLVDATIIRGMLVPAFMKLMGRANWWAPKPLRRIHDRFGLAESVETPAAHLDPAQ